MTGALAHARCLGGIVRREMLRFTHQRARFAAALVRPLVWLIVFGAGLRAMVELPAAPPYDSDPAYELYIVPGLVGMIQLFNGMQSSLSMVYDREMGSMKTLLVSPMPRWFLLLSRLLAGTVVSLVQVYVFLAACLLAGVAVPPAGLAALLPVLLVTGLMLGGVGMLLSSWIRQLENFAGVMNFVIFPMFFLSSALYPLARMRESSEPLYWLSQVNPFTHAVELIRFVLHGGFPPLHAAVTVLALVIAVGGAVWAYDPARGLFPRRAGAAG